MKRPRPIRPGRRCRWHCRRLHCGCGLRGRDCCAASRVRRGRRATPWHRYSQAHPAPEGEDYVILETMGQGHFVGTVYNVQNATPGWWGEGDDKFYIDGDSTPTLQGTGSEDYFNNAFVMHVYPNCKFYTFTHIVLSCVTTLNPHVFVKKSCKSL